VLGLRLVLWRVLEFSCPDRKKTTRRTKGSFAEILVSLCSVDYLLEELNHQFPLLWTLLHSILGFSLLVLHLKVTGLALRRTLTFPSNRASVAVGTSRLLMPQPVFLTSRLSWQSTDLMSWRWISWGPSPSQTDWIWFLSAKNPRG
jgi:hypothetical protein